MSAPQFDLFAAAALLPPAAAASAAKVGTLFPTPPTIPWQRRLQAAGDIGRRVEWHVSRLWSGVVAEMLCQANAGRTLLYAGGEIVDIIPDPGALGRIIYADPAAAAALHRMHRLILIAPAGSGSARFRLAAPGEASPDELALPPGCLAPAEKDRSCPRNK